MFRIDLALVLLYFCLSKYSHTFAGRRGIIVVFKIVLLIIKILIYYFIGERNKNKYVATILVVSRWVQAAKQVFTAPYCQ